MRPLFPLRLAAFALLTLCFAGIRADDWRDDPILPAVPDTFEGFLGLSEGPAAAAFTGDTAADASSLYSRGPFGLGEDESSIYSIEAIEQQYLRPEPDEGFERLTLNAAVREAFDGNLSLQTSARQLVSSSSERREAVADFIPFVDLAASFNRVHSQRDRLRRSERRNEEFEGESFTDFRDSRTITGTGSATVGQNLPWGGDVRIIAERRRVDNDTWYFERQPDDRTDSERHTATMRVEYAQPLLRGAGWLVGTADLKRARLGEMNEAIAFELRRRDVALNIIQRYYDVLRGQLDIEVSRAALREVDSFLKETRVRYELGLTPESEISRAEIRFLQEKQRFVQRQQRFEASIDDLLTEMGLPLRVNVVLDSAEDQLIDLRLAGIPPLDEAIAEALGTRMELMQQAISVELARLNLDLATNNLLPDLNLEGSWSGIEENDERLRWQDLEARRELEGGVSFALPLPNIGAHERRFRARLSLENALTRQEEERRNVISQVREAYRNLSASETSTRILARTVEQSRRSLTLENARYEAGLNTSTDVRSAQDDLFQAQADYNQALLQMQIDIARLYRALGRPIF